MASGGIIHRQSDGYLMLRSFITDSVGAIVSTGNTELRLYQLLEDGTLASLDFNDSIFKVAAWTTQSVNMTHRTGHTATATGLWTYRILLSALVSHASSVGVFFARVTHASGFPLTQVTEFAIGGADGDVKLNASNQVKAEVSSLSDLIKPWMIYNGSSYDHELQNINFMVHAERDGVHQNIKNVSISMYTNENVLVGAVGGTIDNAGKKFFSLQLPSISLIPDRTYFVQTTVTDMNDVVRISGSTAVSFD